MEAAATTKSDPITLVAAAEICTFRIATGPRLESLVSHRKQTVLRIVTATRTTWSCVRPEKINRHTELIELLVSHSKQRTETQINRHKTWESFMIVCKINRQISIQINRKLELLETPVSRRKERTRLPINRKLSTASCVPFSLFTFPFFNPNRKLSGVCATPSEGVSNHSPLVTGHCLSYTGPHPSIAGVRMAAKKRVRALTHAEAQKLIDRERAARRALKTAEREREELNQIGIALSSQRDIGALLTLILAKVRQITAADAGSLYLIGEDDEGRHLRFVLTQNDSLDFPFQEFVLPLAEDSMAGYTALRGEILNFADAYKIPRNLPFKFNDRYDRDTGYRTRSLLTLPMRNARGEVLGVLQLINCKRNPAARLHGEADAAKYVQPFRGRSVRLALSLASQATVAYENRKLSQEIEGMLDGFVNAAVTAIEQRDPTTSGHSLRVAAYTQGLAEIVDAVGTGPYSGARFNAEQLKEIRYAALLHDFGKVGVREEVLVKAKKLYPLQLEIVRQRFDYIRKEIETNMVRRKLQAFLEGNRGDALSEVARISEDFDQRMKALDGYLDFILEANEPTLLEHGKFQRLREIAAQFFRDSKGLEQPYLKADEARMLSIPKGSLDAAERAQIESHAIHTFVFLSQIPWTKELRKIPDIARAHHEKLNGTGYPYKLRADEIPLPTKMMTICDIYDALTASDRPYKKAVPAARALSILEDCVRAGELDAELFRLFCEARVYERGKRSA
jgi:HD-GYP domain-containing protein (c-di-GMP phosphodiesterase class II)